MEPGELGKEEIIKALAFKYKKSISEIRKIVHSQANFTVLKMKEDATIRWPYFGVFKPNIKQKNKIKEQNDKSRSDQESK